MNLEATDPQALLKPIPAQDFRSQEPGLQELRPQELRPQSLWTQGARRFEEPMRLLQREWALYAVFCLAFLAGGTALLSQAWRPDLGLRWLVLPALGVGYLLGLLWRNLDANRRQGEEQLLPSLGWGNRLTLLRGVLAAGMLGFWVLPRPEGWLAWIPGLLYILANASDFFDGYVARVTDHATRLGQRLDMSLDGLGVLVASVLAVQYGQAPAWYLLVGAARYLFLAGEWLRRRFGRPIYPIPPSFNRRVFAGLQMGFLAVALLPLIPPPGIQIAATLFGLPLLVGFGRDWLYASGVLKSHPEHNAGKRAWISRWAPVGLRLAILVLNIPYMAGWLSTYPAGSWAFWLVGGLYGLAVGMLVLGILPSVAAILALLGLGLAQLLAPLSATQVALGVLYVLILYNGSGALSLYNPEAYLYRNYAGENRGAGKQTGAMKRLRPLRWLVWLGLLPVLLWLLRSSPLGEIRAILVSINPWALAGLIAFNGLAMVVFSSRWWLALRSQGHDLPYLTVFRYRMAAFAISYFTPGTQFGGEPLQVYTVSSLHAVPAATAVASVTLDKLFELLANFTFLVIGVVVILRQRLFTSLPPDQGSLWAVGLLALPLAYLILLWSGRSPFTWLVGGLSTRLPEKIQGRLKAQTVIDVAKSAEEQLHWLLRRRPLRVLPVAGVSVLIWLFSLAEYWLALRVLGAHLSLGQAVAALTLTRLAFLTPIPGGLGALEAGQMLALGAMGFSPALGIAISLWIRVRDTALGLIGLWWGAGLIQQLPGRSGETVRSLPSQAGD